MIEDGISVDEPELGLSCRMRGSTKRTHGGAMITQ